MITFNDIMDMAEIARDEKLETVNTEFVRSKSKGERSKVVICILCGKTRPSRGVDNEKFCSHTCSNKYRSLKEVPSE